MRQALAELLVAQRSPSMGAVFIRGLSIISLEASQVLYILYHEESYLVGKRPQHSGVNIAGNHEIFKSIHAFSAFKVTCMAISIPVLETRKLNREVKKLAYRLTIIPMTTLSKRHENQRGQGVCSRPHRCTVGEPGFEHKAPGSEAQAVASWAAASLWHWSDRYIPSSQRNLVLIPGSATFHLCDSRQVTNLYNILHNGARKAVPTLNLLG